MVRGVVLCLFLCLPLPIKTSASPERRRSLYPSCRRLLLGLVAFFYVSLPLSLSSYKNISFAKSRGQKRPATDAELPRNLCSIAPLQSCCKLLPISPCLRSLCFVLLPLFLLPPVAWWKKRIGLWFRAVKVACLTERTGEKKCPRVIRSTECYIMIFSRKSCRLAARRRKRGKRRGTRLMCLMELCFMILS